MPHCSSYIDSANFSCKYEVHEDLCRPTSRNKFDEINSDDIYSNASWKWKRLQETEVETYEEVSKYTPPSYYCPLIDFLPPGHVTNNKTCIIPIKCQDPEQALLMVIYQFLASDLI